MEDFIERLAREFTQPAISLGPRPLIHRPEADAEDELDGADAVPPRGGEVGSLKGPAGKVETEERPNKKVPDQLFATR